MKILSQEEKVALEKAGLSGTEQFVYLYLLEYGDQNPTDIAKATHLLSPNTYTLLKTLVHKGFVLRLKKGKRYIYRAKEPEALLSIFVEQKKMFETVIPALELLRYKEKNKPSSWILHEWGLHSKDEMMTFLVPKGHSQYSIKNWDTKYDEKIHVKPIFDAKERYQELIQLFKN